MKNEKPLISLVVPVYNEADNIGWFYTELSELFASLANYSYEIIYINDGSRDSTHDLITSLSLKDKHVRYICLARNFGKEAATSAGIHYAQGDAVIILDGDGQHPPQLIPQMLTLWGSGTQHIVGIRTSNKKAGLIKRLGSKLFYRLTRLLGAHSVVANATDFRLVDREVVEVFKLYREKKRMTRALLDWSGFTTQYIEFEARDREHGEASYNIRALTRLAVNGYISATLKPLYFVGGMGFVITVLTSIALLVLFVHQYLLGDPLQLNISGSAFITLFITLLVGILMISQGIVALYVANVHLEAQDRPLYIVNKARSRLQ